MTDAPSGWRVSQALSAYQSARARLLAEDLEADVDAVLLEAEDVEEIKSQLVLAIQWSSQLAEATDAMIQNLDARRHRYKQRERDARATLFAVMDALGETKAALPHATVSVTAGKSQLITSGEPPDRFARVKREWDRQATKEALLNGEVVDGAVLSNSMPTLTIRSK